MSETVEGNELVFDEHRLRERLEAVREITDACLLVATADGLQLRGVDPANVALVDADVEAVGPPDVEEGWEYRRGLHLDAFMDHLSGDTTWLRFGPEDGLTLDSERVEHICTQNLEAQPYNEGAVEKCEDYDYDHHVEVPGYRLRGVLEATANVSTLIRLHRTRSSLTVWGTADFYRKGNPPDWDYRWSIDLPEDEPGQPGLYSGDYVRDVARCIPYQPEPVELDFGSNWPLRMAAPGVRCYIAPRIFDEEDLEEAESDE